MKEKREEREKTSHLWSCYLCCSLDFALMLLHLAPRCVSPGPPGKLPGAGQCESVSLPDPGKPNGSPAGQIPSVQWVGPA